jgi:hypothetical protein
MGDRCYGEQGKVMNQTEAVFEIEEALVTRCKFRVEPDEYMEGALNKTCGHQLRKTAEQDPRY